MMKKTFLILVLLLGAAHLFAQTDTSTYSAGWGDLNYAVPESPAFKILGTSPSDIMRPASVKNIAVSVGNYLAGNGGTIPQNMAVELSPAILTPNVNLSQFQRHAFWYTSTLSIGTKVNADKSYAIALGLKFTLFDKTDLRTNSVLIKAFDQMARQTNISYTDAVNTLAKEYWLKDKAANGKNAKGFEHWIDSITDAHDHPKGATDSLLLFQVNNLMGKAFNPLRISAFRDSVKKATWNKFVWDLGIASLFNSKDSLLRDIQPASKIGLWTTAGFPLLGTKGQLLIGITGQLRDTVNSRLSVAMLNIGARAYYGSNDLKGFIEGNNLIQTYQQDTWKASIGIETTFVGGLWVDFSLGLSKQGNMKAQFTPGFNIFFGNGEKKTSGS